MFKLDNAIHERWRGIFNKQIAELRKIKNEYYMVEYCKAEIDLRISSHGVGSLSAEDLDTYVQLTDQKAKLDSIAKLQEENSYNIMLKVLDTGIGLHKKVGKYFRICDLITVLSIPLCTWIALELAISVDTWCILLMLLPVLVGVILLGVTQYYYNIEKYKYIAAIEKVINRE